MIPLLPWNARKNFFMKCTICSKKKEKAKSSGLFGQSLAIKITEVYKTFKNYFNDEAIKSMKTNFIF